MVTVRVELDGPIEEFFEGAVNLGIVFARCYVVVILPITHEIKMLFQMRILLQRHTNLLDYPR